MKKIQSLFLRSFFWELSLSIFILFLSGTAYSAKGENPLLVSWFPKVVNQGDICVVDVLVDKGFYSLTGQFQEKALSFYEIKKGELFRTLIGLDLATSPGTYEIIISARDSSGNNIESKHRIVILKKDFETQRLTLPEKMVQLNEKTLKRVGKESKSLSGIWYKTSKERLWHNEFIRPVNGEVISQFGVRRILNDLPRSPHTGIDLRAKMGEEILCSNTGIVVYVDELYFSGKSVVVDHGSGLYTMYFHLSRINVKEGQRIAGGEVLGLVGASGRSTGPHLHWGVRLGGARVNPLCLLKLK